MKPLSRALVPLLLGVFSVISAPALLAQAPAPALSPDAQAQLAEMKARLNLSEAQQAQLKPLLEQHGASLKAIRAQYGAEPSRQDKRAMFKSAKEEQAKFEGQLGGVLTPQQMEEWKSMQKEMRAKAKERWQENR